MKKFLIIAQMLLLLLALNSLNSYACSFPDDPDTTLEEKVKVTYQSATDIFLGKVIEIKIHPDNQNKILVKLEMDETWKGDTSKEIFVSTDKDGWGCGVLFDLDEKYLVYANKKNGELSAHLCSRTTKVSRTKDIPILNKLKKN